MKKKKVDEGQSKIKAAESDEEEQSEEEERKMEIESRITQETPPQRREPKSLPSSPTPIPTKISRSTEETRSSRGRRLGR